MTRCSLPASRALWRAPATRPWRCSAGRTAIASKFGASDSSVLFLGNSLTNNAIDPYAFKKPYTVLQRQAPEGVEKITPDGTTLSDWYCIYSNFLATQKSPPKILVMGFAWAQLSDQFPIDPARLGGFFCGPDDVTELSSTGLTRHDNLLAFMALTSPKLGAGRIRTGDEIITVAAGFPTTVTPIIQFGAIPVFVDVTLPSYNIDVAQLDAAPIHDEAGRYLS